MTEDRRTNRHADHDT